MGGGFQNQDVGKSNLRGDFGPEYGLDYARFSDSPDVMADTRMIRQVKNHLFSLQFNEFEVRARNGFVFIRLSFLNDDQVEEIKESLSEIGGIREVIIQKMAPENFQGPAHN